MLDQRGDVRDWAPPGWQLRGPRSVQREPAPEEVVHRRIREEDEHVRRYMYLLDRYYSNSWSFLQKVPYHVSYDPVRVSSLWMRSAGGSAPRGSGTGRS